MLEADEGPDEWGGAGKGALEAIWRDALRDEPVLLRARGGGPLGEEQDEVVALHIDLAKCYDTVNLARVGDLGLTAGLDPVRLGMVLLQYAAARRIAVAGAVGRQVGAVAGIVPGCAFARVILGFMLRTATRSAAQAALNPIVFRRYMDDMRLACKAPARAAVMTVSEVGRTLFVALRAEN